MKRRLIVMVLSGSLLVAAPTAAFAHGGEGCGFPGHGGKVVNRWPGHGGKVVHHRHGHGGKVGESRPDHGGSADCD